MTSPTLRSSTVAATSISTSPRAPWLALAATLAVGTFGCADDGAATPAPSGEAACTDPNDARPACQKPSPAAATRRADAPPFALHGPFAVGYRTHEIPGEGGARTLAVKSWYPALAAASEEKPTDYRLVMQRPEWQGGDAVVHGQAIADGALDRRSGARPLIVFSHGYSLDPAWYGALLEHYASWGFVVLAPEHRESDWLLAAAASFDRPADVARTLDLAERLNAPDGLWTGGVDLTKTSAVGHSYGGFTSLSLGGARFDLAPFQAQCAELAPGDPNAFFCAPFLGKEAEMAKRAGLDSVPTGVWPARRDARIKAIVPIAGDAYLFGETGLAAIDVPLMAIGGTVDFGTPYEWGTAPSYAHASSPTKALVGLQGANHMIATNACETMPFAALLPPFEQGFVCLDPVWDKARALDVVRHFSTAFLLDVVANDAAAHQALLPTGTPLPGLTYAYTTPAP